MLELSTHLGKGLNPLGSGQGCKRLFPLLLASLGVIAREQWPQEKGLPC